MEFHENRPSSKKLAPTVTVTMNETILQVVQRRQNQWLCHVLKMKYDRIAKNTLIGRTERPRRVAKSRTS